MDALVKGLTWPVISLLIVGASHFAAEALRPELQAAIVPAVALPVYLVVGSWAAFATQRAGGTFIHGLIAGAVLGLLPVVLQLVGFGAILGRDAAVVATSGAFGWVAIFWGGTLGAGLAMSTPSVATARD